MRDDIEKKEIYEIDNKKYTVITRSMKGSESTNSLYEAFSRYVLQQLKYSTN